MGEHSCLHPAGPMAAYLAGRPPRRLQAAPTLTQSLLAGGALAGAGLLLYTEIPVLLEVAGLLAAGQFLLKLVFAEEREQTFTQIK